MQLSSPVSTVSGIGPSLSTKLQKLEINTVFDLLYHLPFRYEDRSQIKPVKSLRVGDTCSVSGTLTTLKNEYTRRGKNIQTATLTDASGSLNIVWFNQPFLTRTLKTGAELVLYGKVEFFGRSLTMISPDYELVRQTQLHTARLVPVYPETAGISSKWLRLKVHQLLQSLPDTDPFPSTSLPADFPNWKSALKTVHFPDLLSSVPQARSRLAFDELLILQLTALARRQAWKKTSLAHALKIPHSQLQTFINNLPFVLTPSQQQAIAEILDDLSQATPMNRLLEGDVGSGKTVVAAVAAFAAHLNHLQTLILAPTQILAQQHFQTLQALFNPLGITVSLVTSATNSQKARKEQALAHIIVGTHAALTDKFSLPQVGLVIIDEQHRFGVIQRTLAAQKGISPHVLTMTATPIPRTIALTMYGDLDLSVLTDSPTGRLPVKTWVVPESKRTSAYNWIKDQLTSQLAFVVCPLIEDSESAASLKSVTSEYTRLQSIFPEFKLGLLHGKLPAKTKDEVIRKFRSHAYQLLVTTPVVEVGIDIPDATVMLIETADRFGLAQLHQLRGRVGRSQVQSYCLLFSDQPDSRRLKALETTYSGLKLAELDLSLRGPGDIYGTAQHGLPQFKVATFSDFSLIETAKTAAASLYPQLEKLPLLHQLVKNDKIADIKPL